MQLHNPDGPVIMYIKTDRADLPKDGTFVGRQMHLLLLKCTKRDRDHKLVMQLLPMHPLLQFPTVQQHLKETEPEPSLRHDDLQCPNHSQQKNHSSYTIGHFFFQDDAWGFNCKTPIINGSGAAKSPHT